VFKDTCLWMKNVTEMNTKGYWNPWRS